MKGIIAITSVTAIAFASVAGEVRFGIQVLDIETKLPVSGAEVSAGFETDLGPWTLRGRYQYERKQGLTDKNGQAKFAGSSNYGESGVCVRHADGYYTPVSHDGPKVTKKNLFGVWQPENVVVTAMLQRVGQPIPLWVKKERLNVGKEIANVNGGKFSYDLMMGAWLPPFGDGKVADIEFTRLPHEDLGEAENKIAVVKGRAFRDSMSVKFLGADNGLVECQYPPHACLKIRTAPESGYKSDYLCWYGIDKQLKFVTNYDEGRCFAFRIRTEKDEQGRIVKAYYGKFYKDILIYRGYNYIFIGTQFCYYLNPKPLERNLEWDRVHNLCPDAEWMRGGSLYDHQP